MTCPFCDLAENAIYMRGEGCVAFFDKYPISPGHLLVIPTKHVASIFDLEPTSYQNLMKLVFDARRKLDEKFDADAFNVGVNDGIDAGQTIGHAHIHIVPRYKGDVGDARGGVRWILPQNAKYWSD